MGRKQSREVVRFPSPRRHWQLCASAHARWLSRLTSLPHLPKLRANRRHLPVWESKATNLLITVEALRANPAYARARQKHEQELAHAEKVIKTIKEEGFWDGRIHNSKTYEN